MPIHVELRAKKKMVQQLGRDAVHALAVTRFAVSPGGRTVGKIIITMSAGLPDAVFRSTFAHELSHAVLRDRNINGLPLMVEEGMAEFISHTFLTKVERGPRGDVAAGLARSIAECPDPVYGAGFRSVQHAVHRYGFRSVFVAMYRKDLGSVGLPN